MPTFYDKNAIPYPSIDVDVGIDGGDGDNVNASLAE
jgi:hypothetical protein